MSKVSDLEKEMYVYDDVGVALQVQAAIHAAIDRKLIKEEDALSGEVLGEIRVMIYDLNEKPDPTDLLFQALAGKTANPVEAALQFIERKMRE